MAELVAAELARPPLVADRRRPPRPAGPVPAGPALASPGGRGPDRRGSSRPRACRRGCEASRSSWSRATSARPLDPATGQSRWSADLGAPAVWVGYLADKLLAATSQRVVALDLNTGRRAVAFRPGRSGRDPAAGRPVRPRRARPASPDRGARPAPRLPARRRPALLPARRRGAARPRRRHRARRLVLLAARAAPINPKLWIGPGADRAPGPEAGSAPGARDRQRPPARPDSAGRGRGARATPVPIDDDHVLLVTDRRTVKKFDLGRGQFSWDYRESLEMPVNGPPRVIGDAERLLVLHDGRPDPARPGDGSKRWSGPAGHRGPERAARRDRLRRAPVLLREPGQNLRALSLDDGQRALECHLSGPENAQWSIALSERCVVAYPSLSAGSEEEIESMPVVVRRQDTGALVQRFVFPATIADVSLRLDARGALLATSRGSGRLARRRGRSPNPDPCAAALRWPPSPSPRPRGPRTSQ